MYCLERGGRSANLMDDEDMDDDDDDNDDDFDENDPQLLVRLLQNVTSYISWFCFKKEIS